MALPEPLTPLGDGLLPAAMRDGKSRGRRHAEAEHPYRGAFQRDRDRVVHSAHFRRLEYKTQVFVNGEGDNYRTRLTHTLEVTQIARSLARALRLNEDLAEAAALSHDLGHTPFGHAGERVLDRLLAEEGGFNHNDQGLRVVDFLEERYAAFPGLNLTHEVREGFFQHGGRRAAAGGEFAAGDAPLLEIAATLIADDIAYIAHDIDDGLYSGLLAPGQLAEQALWREATGGDGFAAYPDRLKRTEGVRRLINLLVTDVIETTRKNLEREHILAPDDARGQDAALVGFSGRVEAMKSGLKAFLFRNFYRHPAVMEVVEKGEGMLAEVFLAFAEGGEPMPEQYREIAGRFGRKKAAADYVAGMTDRFLRETWNLISGKNKNLKKTLTTFQPTV